MRPAVSALVACHGEHAEWVSRTLWSAHNAGAEEVVLVNDGTPNPELVKPIPRLRVYSRPSAGVAATLNYALEQATQPYVARLDIGDTWQPAKLAVQVGALAAGDNRACFCDYHSIMRNEDWLATGWEHRLWTTNVFHGSTTMVERAACLQWDESLAYASDWEWHVRMHCEVGWLYVPEVLAQADEWPGGLSDTARQDGKLMRHKHACKARATALIAAMKEAYVLPGM